MGCDVGPRGLGIVRGVRWKFNEMGTERTRRCGREDGDVDILPSTGHSLLISQAREN